MPFLRIFSLYNVSFQAISQHFRPTVASLLLAKKLSHTSNVLIGGNNFRPPSKTSSLFSSVPYRAIFLKTFHNSPYLSFWRQILTVESSITPSKRPSDGSHGTGFVPLLYNKDSVLQVKNHWKRPKSERNGWPIGIIWGGQSLHFSTGMFNKQCLFSGQILSDI